jgi:large subunit ribosomal protein L17
MRHRNAGRTLGRTSTHRLALFRNLTRALFEHGRITTTLAKAKEVRPFVEKLITLAKRGIKSGDNFKSLHARRLALQRLHDRETIAVLFRDIAPRYLDREGGYTRIIKLHKRRLGDAGFTALLELLKEGETKVRAKPREQPPAPAPVTKQPEAPAAADQPSLPTS